MQQARRYDGKPETEADRRFFDLRDAGYTGPIDQDGCADVDSDAAAILREMALNRGEQVQW